MRCIWIVLLEVFANVDSAPTGKLGFINVVVSADDTALAEAKVRSCLEGYEWEILSIESISEVDPEGNYSDEINELIDDVIVNPGHIRLATLHTYKPN